MIEGLNQVLTVERKTENNAVSRAEQSKTAMRAAPLAGEVAAAKSAFVLKTIAASALEVFTILNLTTPCTSNTQLWPYLQASKEADASEKEKADAVALKKKADQADVYAQQVTLLAAEKEYAEVQDDLFERIRGNDPKSIKSTGAGASALAQLTYMSKVDAVADAVAAVKAGKLEQKALWAGPSSGRPTPTSMEAMESTLGVEGVEGAKAWAEAKIDTWQAEKVKLGPPTSPTSTELRNHSQDWINKIDLDMAAEAKAAANDVTK